MDLIIVVIEVATMVEVYIGLKIPSTIPITIVEQWVMLMVEVDICLIPATLPPITQETVIDCWVYHFLIILLPKILMVMRYQDIMVM